jgi:Zn-dependent protease with chaperone function
MISPPLFFAMIKPNSTTALFSIPYIMFLLTLFLIYFRFIFGYFMRHFEREADLHCFRSGVNPQHLISTFSKLNHILQEDEKKPNWHHFNLSERIDFLQKSMKHPELIKKHQQSLFQAKLAFVLIFVFLTLLSAMIKL